MDLKKLMNPFKYVKKLLNYFHSKIKNVWHVNS